MTRQQVLDLYFLDARHKLIELAAFLDRVERAAPSSPSASTRQAKEDFRLTNFRAALGELSSRKKQKAKNVLLKFSDPTTKPIEKALGKGACGAVSFKNIK
jgi:hypothetical protein